MAKVNRYDVAAPAKDNYFNTFVPLPLDQLTALGMARRQELEKNQDLLDKAYSGVIDVKYIKESPHEEANYRDLVRTMTDINNKYATADLTNPVEYASLRRDLRTKIDPTLIKRMEESWANNEQKKSLKMDLLQKGMYNEYLDEDPVSGYDSKKGAVYNYLPEAYQGREKLLDPYFKDLKPSFKGVQMRDGLPLAIMSVDDSDIARVANPERAQELLSTPAGKQEVKLFQKMYPDLAKDMSPTQIMGLIMTDYAEQKKQEIPDVLPEYAYKAWAAGQQSNVPSTGDRPLTNLRAGEIDTYNTLASVRYKIQSLKESGNTEASKDLQIAYDEAVKRNKVSKEDIDKEVDMQNWSLQASFPGDVPISSDRKLKDPAAVKVALNEISSTVSSKYAFGFPTYTSGNLVKSVDPSTGDPTGVSDMSFIATDAIINYKDNEIFDVNGKGTMSKEKFAKNIAPKINADNLESVNIEVVSTPEKDYKPLVTLHYNTLKDGVNNRNKISLAINDFNQQLRVSGMLYERGNNDAAAAIMNPHLSSAIANDSFDNNEMKTYKILTNYDQKANDWLNESPVNVRRNPEDPRRFDIILDSPNGGKTIETVNSRQELIAQLYYIMGQNKYSRFEKE